MSLPVLRIGRGARDRDGLIVDEALGFTAKAVTPAILLGSVAGKVAVESQGHIAKSDRQFSLILSDEQYDSVMEAVDAGATGAQPSYNLNRANLRRLRRRVGVGERLVGGPGRQAHEEASIVPSCREGKE